MSPPEAESDDTQPGPAGGPGASLPPGTLVGARYTLLAPLGAGAWAVVYRALDAATGAEVALKVFRGARAAASHEAARLGRCAGEGVVRFRDSGAEGDLAWIAMDLLEGPAPFTTGVPHPPDEVLRFAAPVARTLARIHHLGVVHADLKPQNLRGLAPGGAPLLLDFGVARDNGAPLREPTGTPGYRAPEMTRPDARITDRADVFSLGVILYEALEGRRPFAPDSFDADADPPAAPAPRGVRDLLARMLAREPERRPGAAEVFAALAGTPAPEPEALPWLGPPPAPGFRGAIGGGRGAGKSRLLRELARLEGEVLWLLPGDRPWAALERALGESDEDPVAFYTARLDAARLPLFADDWESLDPESRELLLGHPRARDLVRAVRGPGDRAPARLSAADLHALFEGPDPVLHLREDAAEALFLRTGGWAGRVVAELRDWVERGWAIPTGGSPPYRVSREALDRLASEPARPREQAELRAPEDELLTLIEMAASNATTPNIGAMAGAPAAEVRALLRRLEEAQLLTQVGERWLPHVRARGQWSAARQRAAWSRLADALPRGASGRTRALLQAGRHAELATQAIAEVEHLERQGRPVEAMPLLRLALTGAPRDPDLVAQFLQAALAMRSTEANNEARQAAREAGDPRVAALVDAVLAARGRAQADAATRLRALQFDHPKLEMLRLAARVEATWRGAEDDEERLLQELQQLPLIHGDEENRARWHTWVGGMRYRQRRFAEAAEHHRLGARRVSQVGQASSLNNAARSCLETCDFDTTGELAARALAIAARARLPTHELDAAWILRSIENRRGGTEPDDLLPRSAILLGQGAFTGRVALTEAFMAWRGDHPSALVRANQAVRALDAANLPIAAAYARSLALACGGEEPTEPITRTLWEARKNHPDLALDGLALVGRDLPGTPAERAALGDAFPIDTWDTPRGAYSVREALRRVR